MSSSVRGEIPGKKSPLTRYVIYSNDWGLYLGMEGEQHLWSRLDPHGRVAAPTFSDEVVDLTIADIVLAMGGSSRIMLEGREVIPDMPNNQLTAQAAPKYMLPTWSV
jgi:hypothetical protein